MKESDYSSSILIVTIDPEISNVLNVLLNNINYNIELINSGTEAIKELEENNFDLILLDIVLPDMNITQFLNYTKKISPGALVIIMAAENMHEKTSECLKNGAYDSLKKPFVKEEICKRIENALEQRRLEKEIEDINNSVQITEVKNKYFLQNCDDIIYSLDYEGNFTSFNDSLVKKLGYDSKSLISKHFTSIIHPDDIDKAMYVFNERRNSFRGTEAAKIRLKKKEAARQKDDCITVEVKARGLYDRDIDQKDKLFLGTYGIARDISEIVKNEEILKRQKIYFKELFVNSPEAVAIIDNDGRIVNANKSFEKLFKFGRRELKNNYINDLILPKNISPEDAQATDSMFFQEECTRRCKDGTHINVSVNGCPVQHNGRVMGAYRIYNNITNVKDNEEKLVDSLTKLRRTIGNISNAMVSTVEVRDPYTVGHQQKVSNLARAIAFELGLHKDDIDALRLAGTLHDLGKVNIPAEILSKPGHLSTLELELVKMHPTIAYEILRKADFPWEIAEIVYQHHERLDGSGYPRGLKGEEILLSARILSVADVVESIASHRPYRQALGIQNALEEIFSKKNVFYDSKAVDACIKLFYEKKFSFEYYPQEENESAYSMPQAIM